MAGSPGGDGPGLTAHVRRSRRRTLMCRDRRAERVRATRPVATRANDQPAFALSARDPRADGYWALGRLVLMLAGGRTGGITQFDPQVLPRFGLDGMP
jgi:hypothetical protein